VQVGVALGKVREALAAGLLFLNIRLKDRRSTACAVGFAGHVLGRGDGNPFCRLDSTYLSEGIWIAAFTSHRLYLQPKAINCRQL